MHGCSRKKSLLPTAHVQSRLSGTVGEDTASGHSANSHYLSFAPGRQAGTALVTPITTDYMFPRTRGWYDNYPVRFKPMAYFDVFLFGLGACVCVM